MKLILILAITYMVCSEHCSDDQNQGPFRLKEPERNFPEVDHQEVVVSRYRIVGKAEIIVGYRSNWISYCYNGGALDSNTGCLNTIKPAPPTEGELITWVKTRRCKIGRECKDAWGSDANECCLVDELVKEVPLGTEIEKRSNNNHFAYHTCNRSWRCGASISNLPLVLSPKRKSKRNPNPMCNGDKCDEHIGILQPNDYEILYPTENGKLVKLPRSGSMVYNTSTESAYVEHQTDIILESKNVKCIMIVSKDGGRVSREAEKSTERPLTYEQMHPNFSDTKWWPSRENVSLSKFRFNSVRHARKSTTASTAQTYTSGDWTYYVDDSNATYHTEDENRPKRETTNFAYARQSAISCMDEEWGTFMIGDCIDHVCYDSQRGAKPSHKPEDWKAASMDDLSKVVREVDYRSAINNKNFIEAKEEIFQLKQLLKRTIESVAKQDEKLISRLFGNNFATTFLADDVFYIKPCVAPTPVNSNCINGKVYKGGRWIPLRSDTECISYNTYRNMTLFEDYKLWLPDLMNISFHGIANDLPAWRFLIEEQNNMRDTMEYTKNGGAGTSLEDILAYPKGYLESALHWAVIGPVVFIAIFAMIFCSYCCIINRRIK